MATISSQSTRTSGRASSYAQKGHVWISAAHATVPGFEKRLQDIRRAHGKDGLRPRTEVDDKGRLIRDANSKYVAARDSKGNVVYESKYVEAYSLVQSFGHDELDPNDPESWARANELARAVAEDRFPGHPALVATEVNGRSGCVHNHLIIGAIHPETGKSIDSNIVTHSRLALAHDRVLTEQGFAQREDMVLIAEAVTTRADERRKEIEAEAGFTELSPSQQKRRLLAAENSVRFESRQTDTAHQKRDTRRRRELVRYQQNEQDRQIAHNLGITPPAEKFSELELEGRIRSTLSDPRSTSWESVAEIGRENRVTIERRGSNDVTYGMMLAQPDGTVAEPAKNHRRRGGVEGAKTQGLGDGFRRGDIDDAIEHNLEQQAAADRWRVAQKQKQAEQMADLERQQAEHATATRERIATLKDSSADAGREVDAEIAAFEQGAAERRNSPEHTESHPLAAEADPVRSDGAGSKPAASPGLDEESGETSDQTPVVAIESLADQPAPPAPTPEGPATSAFHRIKARSGSKKVQARIDGMAALEDRFGDQLPSTDSERVEFEQMVKDAGGINKQFLSTYGEHFASPELRDRLDKRVSRLAEARASYEKATAARQAYIARRDECVAVDPIWGKNDPELMKLSDEVGRHNKRTTRIRERVDRGDYEVPDMTRSKKELSDRVAGLDKSSAGLDDSDRANEMFKARRSHGGRGMGR